MPRGKYEQKTKDVVIERPGALFQLRGQLRDVDPSEFEEPEIRFGDDEIGALLRERQTTHGDAWKEVNRVLKDMPDELLLNLKNSGYLMNWIMVQVKQYRAAFNPTQPDNWRDTEGYSRLVRTDLP